MPIFWTTKTLLSWRAKASLKLIETVVFRVEIPEIGALCYRGFNRLRLSEFVQISELFSVLDNRLLSDI